MNGGPHDEAIRRAYLAHYPDLLRFLRRKLRDETDAADLVQESFARWLDFESHGQGGVRAPRAFLFRVAQNLLRDYWQRQSRHAAAVQDGQTAEGRMHDMIPSPEREVERQQRVTQLAQVIRELPPKCREAFTLHKFAGLSHAEVALRMGISRNMVEKHVIHAMLYIRHRLAPVESAAPNGNAGSGP
jgi:RNA polymerase sigma factor (sigma-70 family)